MKSSVIWASTWIRTRVSPAAYETSLPQRPCALITSSNVTLAAHTRSVATLLSPPVLRSKHSCPRRLIRGWGWRNCPPSWRCTWRDSSTWSNTTDTSRSPIGSCFHWSSVCSTRPTTPWTRTECTTLWPWSFTVAPALIGQSMTSMQWIINFLFQRPLHLNSQVPRVLANLWWWHCWQDRPSNHWRLLRSYCRPSKVLRDWIHSFLRVSWSSVIYMKFNQFLVVKLNK